MSEKYRQKVCNMYRIQIKQNYRLECQGAAKVSVLYFIQTDFYYVFVLIASVLFHIDCLHRLFILLLKGTFMNKLQKMM